jgi:hypothetical protein
MGDNRQISFFGRKVPNKFYRLFPLKKMAHNSQSLTSGLGIATFFQRVQHECEGEGDFAVETSNKYYLNQVINKG